MSVKTFKYTIMEIVAVMVIVILLITILLPIFVKSREWGKNIVCKNNLKTLAAAITAYSNDNNAACLPFDYGMMECYSLGTYYARTDWVLRLIDPYSIKYACKANSGTSAEAIIKAPPDMPVGYIPVPKLRRAPVTVGSGYDGLFISPADYSSVLACPSEKINWRNEFFSKAAGKSSSDYTYAWYGSHYGLGPLASYISAKYMNFNSKKNRQHTAMVGDVGWGYTNMDKTLSSDGSIYGRHFGKPVYLTPWTSGAGYRERGPGRGNWAMMDGHIESWSWRAFYNLYKPSSGIYAIGANPFYYVNW